MGQIIQRYRLAALTWCLEAVTAATPKTEPSPWRSAHRPRTSGIGSGPRWRHIGPGERMLDLLAVHHDNQLLDAWQRLARAAALGEHDFGAGVNRGGLTAEQANVVLKDAADVARGLVVLDRRYDNVPGMGAAQAARPPRPSSRGDGIPCRPGRSGPQRRGTRLASTPGRIEGPALPGVAGAVQAQHNLLVELGRLPNALNLRRVLHSQAQVSHEAARHAGLAAPDLVERFSERADAVPDSGAGQPRHRRARGRGRTGRRREPERRGSTPAAEARAVSRGNRFANWPAS